MRTLSNTSGDSVRPPFPVQDSAPSLESAGQKIGANMFSPAPVPAPLIESDAMPVHEQAVIEAALAILRARMRKPSERASTPSAARSLAMLHFAGHQVESFAVMFLDAAHGLIAFEEMSRGTLTETSVYPREIVRAVLRHNAAAVILTHNHPSGHVQPSAADRLLTNALKIALRTVDVSVLDHLVIGGDRVMSFAEDGIL